MNNSEPGAGERWGSSFVAADDALSIEPFPCPAIADKAFWKKIFALEWCSPTRKCRTPHRLNGIAEIEYKAPTPPLITPWILVAYPYLANVGSRIWNLIVLKKKKCRGCFARCSRHCKSAVGECMPSRWTAVWVRLCRLCQLMCVACLSSALRKVCPWDPQHPGHGALCALLCCRLG